MNAITLVLLGMFLLVGGSVLIGELFEHLGTVALVGQLLVGVILGPTLLASALGFTGLASTFQPLQILATFFILVMAGMAITPQQVRATGVKAGLLGVTIFVVPFVLGSLAVRAVYPGLSTTEDLFISLTISITALPVLGVMLREFDMLETRLGSFLMNTAMVNELSAVTTFAVLLQVYDHPGALGLSIASALATTALFLVTILAVYYLLRSLRQVKLWDRWVARFRASWRSRQGGFAILMVVGLGVALYSQYLGLTYLVGAFYCGLLISPETTGPREHRSISFVFEAMTWGFFIPLFFALIGLQMNLRDIGFAEFPLLAFFALGAFALFSKLFVGSAGAKALGWSTNESWLTGFLVTSRGAVELAMAVTLLDLGIFNTKIFTIVAGVGLLTTFVSPWTAKPFVRAFKAVRRPSEEPSTGAPLEPPLSVSQTVNR